MLAAPVARWRPLLWVLAIGLAVTLVGQRVAAEQHKIRACHTGDYLGENKLIYESASSTKWRLLRTRYRLSPADSSSDHNNIHIAIWKVTKAWGWDSPDNLLRDFDWHHLRAWNDFRVSKSQNEEDFTNVLDRFGGDPSCTSAMTL